jgi:hypothetical protein
MSKMIDDAALAIYRWQWPGSDDGLGDLDIAEANEYRAMARVAIVASGLERELESWKKDHAILFYALNEIYREGKGRHVEIARKALNEVGK